ncbi:MAG TPA: sigma-54 dependent transcriptional regulator [Tepidisphaeraceae bacterium]|nr:sigma-54 dependent transcriptional regulator [Tepidisphaeraceae bacterium]
MNEYKPAIAPLRVLIIDDEANIRTMLTLCLEADGHSVVACGTIESALDEIARRIFDLVFLDVRLGMDNGLDFLPALLAESPWAKVIVITAFASIETAVEAMRRGATDYLPKPFEASQVQMVTQKVAQARQLERKVEVLQAALGALEPDVDLPTNSPVMLEALETARQVAATRTPVIIRGELGTGKDRLARAIHAWSNRADGPFAAVSCQQSVDALEAELFGIASANLPVGADRPGRAAFCDGGTLYLDEIGQTPQRTQARILRLAQDQEYERIDEVRGRPVDIRIVASTSVDLQEAVQRGVFRADLLLALDVVQIEIPSLRSRPEDIPMLADRYLAFFGNQHHRPVASFSADAMYALSKYTWPGNVRELRNVVERAVLLCHGGTIGVNCLPPNLLNSSAAYSVGDLVELGTIERMHIEKVVASTRSLRRAASILGIDSGTLCRRMKRYSTQDDQPAA